jgi:hypothetical protein
MDVVTHRRVAKIARKFHRLDEELGLRIGELCAAIDGADPSAASLAVHRLTRFNPQVRTPSRAWARLLARSGRRNAAHRDARRSGAREPTSGDRPPDFWCTSRVSKLNE